MVYLSRIWLNPLRTGAQQMLRSPQVLHAAVLGGISRQPVNERVLWRLDRTQQHRPALLVLTETRPSWEHILEQAGRPSCDEPQIEVRPYETLLDRLAAGREYAFRLQANTVSSTRMPTKPSATQRRHLERGRARGVRVPHRTVEHQMRWLTDRVENWGFTVPNNSIGEPDVRLVARGRLTFPKSDKTGERQRVVLQTATFEGRLRIGDVTAARTSLLAGVGRAKAYGCGLITLAPLAGSGMDL